MRLQDLKSIFFEKLDSIYPPSETETIFFLVCRQLLNYSKIDLHTKKDVNLSDEIRTQFLNILYRLLKNEPVQYILGSTEFYNLRLLTDERALIPRQETELLVDIIVKEYQNKQNLRIIDLCTGTGCIAIALKTNLNNAKVSATDLSKEALELAEVNAKNNHCDISFIWDSILTPEKNYETFDIVVSNPPYVRDSETSLMHKNVIDYEPHLALFVEDSNPLVFYKAIADFAVKHLEKKGIVYCEINEAFGEKTAEIFAHKGLFNTTILKDLNNKDRFIKAYRND